MNPILVALLPLLAPIVEKLIDAGLSDLEVYAQSKTGVVAQLEASGAPDLKAFVDSAIPLVVASVRATKSATPPNIPAALLDKQ